MKYLWVVLFVLMASMVSAATLRWDASTGADGYVVLFNGFNYDAGNNTQVADIDDTLNLHPGTTYTFTVKAYNQMGGSEASNSVEYVTDAAYTPPADSIPVRLTKPSIITIIVE